MSAAVGKRTWSDASQRFDSLIENDDFQTDGLVFFEEFLELCSRVLWRRFTLTKVQSQRRIWDRDLPQGLLSLGPL